MSDLNLSWSFRPLLIFIRCIGIHLPSGQNINCNTKCHLTRKLAVHTWICLLFNFCSQVGDLYLIVEQMSTSETIGQEPLDAITSYIYVIIDYSSYALAPLLCHLILLTIVRPRWAILMKSLHFLESQLDQQFFIKLRRITIIGTAFIILLVLSLD